MSKDAGRGFMAVIVRRRRFVVTGWLLALVAALPFAGRAGTRLEVAARTLGSESAAVERALAERFESPFARSAILVVSGVPGPETAQGREIVHDFVAALRELPGVTRTYSYLDHPEPLFLGASGTFVVVGLDLHEGSPEALVARLRAATEPVIAQVQDGIPDARARWTGEVPLNVDLRHASAMDVRSSERRALPLTLVLLVFAFGSVGGALLSLSCGALAIVVALGGAVALTAWMPLSVTLESVVSMLGLGLGLDYALLTVSRFGEARREGRSVAAAAEDAGRQAGATVLLSGTAVGIGFVGLLLVPLSDVRSIAVGGLLVTAAAVLLATTLLPALLAMLGHRLQSGRGGDGPGAERGHRAWRRWGTWVAAHPMRVLLVAGAPLVGLAAAAQRMQTGLPEDDWLPAQMDSAVAIRDLRAMGRVGVVQTIRVVLELPEDATALSREGWTATKRLSDMLRRDERLVAVRSLRDFAGAQADDLAFVSFLPGFLKHAFVSSEGDAVLLEIVPRESVGSEAASGIVRDLRRMDAAALTGLAGTRLVVGGLPAFNADYSDALARAWWRVLAVVLLGSLLVLAAGFRSLLVPLKAVGLNLLSVAAALGAVVLVFQDGRAAWLGLAGASGRVFPAVPLLVFGIVFGLSLDYEVFLMARVREAKRAGLGEEEAVAEGLARTGGVITSAAAIMVAVFAAFTLADNRLVRMLGFALATAVLLDATLVRVAVGPALLRLAGRWNWWPDMGGPGPPTAVSSAGDRLPGPPGAHGFNPFPVSREHVP